MSIKNIDELRKHAIDTLTKLSTGEISTEQADVTGKLCENVVSTLKIQLEYSKMLGQEPTVTFLEDCTLPNGRLIENIKETKELPCPPKDRMKRR